jgi:hypothetical protein
MAEPNYMAYAQYMGARNPMAEGLNQLGSTLGDIQKNQMERENMKRRNSLADLQMQQGQMQMAEAQRQQEYQQGMRNAAQNPASVTSIAPQQIQQPQTLGQLIPSGMPQNQDFTMPQQAASPTVQAYNEGRVSTKTETPGMSMSKYAMSQGNIADAQKTLTVEDALGQFGAKLQESGGDLTQYYQKKQELDTYKTFISEIAPLLKSPEGRKVAQTISHKYQQMYPGHEQAFDISTISVQPDKLVNTLFDEQGNPAGRLISMPDGTTKFDPPKEEKNQTIEQLTSKALKGDTHAQAILDTMQGREIAKAKANRAIITNSGGGGRGGGSGYPGGKPPVGYRFTEYGDLEAIPGGPADQKITAAEKAQSGAIQAIDTALASIKELVDHPGRKAATGTSSLTNRLAMPGGDARTFLDKLETFKSQMFVPMVQQMKGMGQLSDAEGRKLTAAVGALEPTMSESAFKTSLQSIMRELETTRNRSSKPLTSIGARNNSPPVAPPPKRGAVVDGYMFNGGNPADQKNWKKVTR